jgi:hypothetical protein
LKIASLPVVAALAASHADVAACADSAAPGMVISWLVTLTAGFFATVASTVSARCLHGMPGVPARNAYLIPDEMTWAAAALVEPLSCVVHGLRRLAMPAGAELLVVGAGTIGLLLMQAAHRSGAAAVSVIDPDPRRWERARELGAGAGSRHSGRAAWRSDSRFRIRR